MTNTLFPGRPDYIGPTFGIFGLLHHEVLVESSYNVMERVAYIKVRKSADEIPIRLHNLIYLGGCQEASDYEAKYATLYADYEAKYATVYADYEAKCATLYADYKAKRASLDADYKAKCATLYADYKAKLAPLDAPIIEYIRGHIPDCAWNGKTLVFPRGHIPDCAWNGKTLVFPS